MTRQEERRIDGAIAALAAGRPAVALRELCVLRRCPVPEMREPSRPRVMQPSRSEPKAVAPQPKPRARIVNPKAITAYKKAHPACELAGPDCQGPRDFSHIKPKSAAGPDSANNALVLCRFHHAAWHASRRAWWEQFGERLEPQAQRKVLRAYRELAEWRPRHDAR
jgi:hypothetical protein